MRETTTDLQVRMILTEFVWQTVNARTQVTGLLSAVVQSLEANESNTHPERT